MEHASAIAGQLHISGEGSVLPSIHRGAADAPPVTAERSRSRVPGVMRLFSKIQQCFGANINQAQDPVEIDTVGQLPAVDSASAAVRDLDVGNPCLDEPSTESSGHRGPAGGLSGSDDDTAMENGHSIADRPHAEEAAPAADECTVYCPHEIAGRVTGHDGQTLRLIEQETGASMLLHLAIWGSSDAIEMARDMVNEILDGESGSEQAILQGDAAAESRVVIDCPTSRIGLVIGRHGATIRALERTYDVCIETVHCQHPAQIIIEGAALAVDAAAVDVRELINRGWQHLDPPGTGRSRFGGPEGPGSSTGPRVGGVAGPSRPGLGGAGFPVYGQFRVAPPPAAFGGYPGTLTQPYAIPYVPAAFGAGVSTVGAPVGFVPAPPVFVLRTDRREP